MTLFTDLPALTDAAILPGNALGEDWVPVTFETAEFSGTGLATGGESGARELSLDLGLTGQNVLYLALGPHTGLQAWLDGDLGYQEFVPQHGGNNLQECRFNAADLTGRRLHIKPKNDAAPQPVFLGYIRAEKVEASQTQPGKRNLVATNDGWSWVALEGLESRRDVWRFFEPLRQSDFGLMLWGIGGADLSACHISKIGTTAPFQSNQAFRTCDRVHAEHLGKYLRDGGDLLRDAVEAARDTGLEIHFYIRPEAFAAPFPHEHTFASKVIHENPGWRCRDEFGDEILRLSYAYPEVQEHMLAFFEEILEYGPDGLCLAFNRSLPMMICEEPVLAEYEKRHGRRPNLPEEVDSDEMVAVRTDLMNGFLERVHAQLQSKNMKFSCMVTASQEEMHTSGLDLAGLCERGIFSEVCIHSGGFHANATSIAGDPFWQRIRDNGHARVYPNGWGGSYQHDEAARFLKETVFDTGFSGGFFWDTENLTANPYNWEAVRYGGSMDHLEKVISGETKPPRIVTMTRVQGVKLGRYNPGRSY